MAKTNIEIRGAHAPKFKKYRCGYSKDKLTVITGLSSSGNHPWHSIRFMLEGQRQYVELVIYALSEGKWINPIFDLIIGLSPAISIDQKTNV